MNLAPVERAPLSLTVSARLREAILDGSLACDDVLPTEHELAATFGVGRSTIREALRVLQSQGLLSGADSTSTTRPRVTHQRTAQSAADALGLALRLGAIPLDDLVALRVVLGSEAMRTSLGVPPEAREALEVMAGATTDPVTFHAADVDFHVALAGSGGNQAFGLVMSVLHRAILAALDTGEGARASELVAAHIRGFYAAAPR